jgi:uncharacterized protein YndB with AHSA1/START domain
MEAPRSETVMNGTKADRSSDRELVVTRVFDGPARIVFEAWTKPELLMRWWVPKSFGFTFVSCELDVRVGGMYKFVFSHPQFDEPMTFFGRYVTVEPPSKLVWTNDEGSGAVTTVTFDERGGKTYLELRELYPSKEALDEALEIGNGYPEQFNELDAVLKSLA